MSQGRIFPLVGPLLVLYLIAEVAASSQALDATAYTLCAVALMISGVPPWLVRREGARTGSTRVILLGVAVGVLLVRFAQPELRSLYLDLGAALGISTVGVLVVHLAFDAPDQPPALVRRRNAIHIATALGVFAFAASALSVVPAIPWFGDTGFGSDLILVPPRWSYAAPIFAITGLCVAGVLRVVRRRLGSPPEAIAAGSWAQLGTWMAIATGLLGFGLYAADVLAAESASSRGLWALGSAALIAGHIGMLGARRQVRAGRNTRRLVSGTLALAIVGIGAALLTDHIPRGPVASGVAFAFGVLLAGALMRAFDPVVARVLSPFGGRLVRGVDEALDTAFAATSLAELGAAILPPLGRASGDMAAEPLVYAIDPPRMIRVDAAGAPHVEERELASALVDRLTERPGDVVILAPIAERVVRRPELRSLVEALERLEALCVVPLSVDRELEGALVIPRGRRRSPLTLEEIDRLERLGRRVAAQVSMLSAHERSRLRTRDAVLARERLDEQLEAQQEELDKLRADAQILKAGGATERFREPAIAYSASMRALSGRIQEVGPVDAPVLLIGEDGTALDRIGHMVHAAGGRRGGPFVVASCASVRPERAEAALFGEQSESQPGWLRLADGGTCLLLDVPALSLSAQAKLAEAIGTRRAQHADSGTTFPIDARVVATSRTPLETLVDTGTFDAELYRRLEPLMLNVPPLRERAEDVPSLVLLALDRTCRTMGRPVVGMEPAALEKLVAYSWPGNLRELRSVIDRAVLHVTGKAVVVEDLPPLVSAGQPNIWEGSYADIERRLLVRALEKADGNKSEAARSLGLKRTTFLDKLKRHGLHAPHSPSQPPAAISG